MYNDKAIRGKDGQIHSKSWFVLVFRGKEQDSVGSYYTGTVAAY